MLNDLVLEVLKISLTTSAFIGGLLLLIPLLQKRYRVQWRYFAWILIAVRLLIPFSPTLPEAPIRIELPEHNAVVMNQNIEDTISQKAIQIQQENKFLMDFKDVSPMISDIAKPELSPLEIADIVWIIGICTFLLFQVGSYQIFLRKLRLSKKESVPDFIRETISEIGLDVGVCKLPKPIITDAVGAPVLIGILKPRILLPHTHYSVEEIRFILRHELSHYRRNDMWYKLVLLLANAVHWFNPLVYLMNAQAARDIESVCDYDVAKKLNYNELALYANTILSAMPVNGGLKPMLSTQFGSSKKDMKSRLRNLFDMNNKRRGVAALCTLMLCTLLGTGVITFAYSDKDAISGELTAINGLLINAKAVDGTWAYATGIIEDTWEKQMEEEIKWLNEVYDANKSDFVIKETLPIEETTNIARLKYLYENSDVFRKMSQMKNGVFQAEDAQSFSGYSHAYEQGMMQRIAVMIDNDAPFSLDIDYKLTQGEMAVLLVNPFGKIMYQGVKSAIMKDMTSYAGDKGLWSVIMVVDGGDNSNRLSGKISISLISSIQDSQLAMSTSSNKNFSVERLGQHTLEKGDNLNADLRWDGNGYAIMLYTKNNLTDNQLLKPLQGLPNLPKPDDSTIEQGKIGGPFNFYTSQNSPLKWNKNITTNDNYYFYIICVGDPGQISGDVSILKSDGADYHIWPKD